MPATKKVDKGKAPVLKVLLITCITSLFVLLSVIWYVGFHDRGMSLTFDPTFVADTETAMWKAYYENAGGVSLGRNLLTLMRTQFGLSYRSSVLIAEDIASATVRFRSTREESQYEQKVLPDLVSAYSRLRRATNGKWDPTEVAKTELEWWAARRDPERNSPENVGKIIAHEYSLIYGKDNQNIRRAGLLRAEAARLRDEQKNADWKSVNELLRESYTELIKGIVE
jgi:hypothetical protein